MTVRRCQTCRAPKMVCVSTYGGEGPLGFGFLGRGGLTAWVCQQCGHAVTLHATPWIWLPVAFLSLPLLPIGLAAAVVGMTSGDVVMAIIMGGPMVAIPVGLIGAVLWPWWVRRRHPEVPGAEPPEVRFTETEPLRTCSCGGLARCTCATATRTNGVYTGTEYAYECQSCDRTFTIESPLSVVLLLAGGTFLLAIAVLLRPASWTDGWQGIAVFAAFAIVGLITLLMGGWQLGAGWRYPIAPRS